MHAALGVLEVVLFLGALYGVLTLIRKRKLKLNKN